MAKVRYADLSRGRKSAATKAYNRALKAGATTRQARAAVMKAGGHGTGGN